MRKNLVIACLMAVIAFAGNAKTADFKAGTVNTIHTDEFMEKFVDQEIPSRPAVIDVSAEWCGWCKKMHPHLEQLAKKYSGKIDFYQLNYETDLDLIRQLGVSSYPTLIYIKADGKVVIDDQGFRVADELDETLQEVFFGGDESMVHPSGSWPSNQVASWPTESWPVESWPNTQDLASWPTESWPGTQVASWPTESWPSRQNLASWPTESWPGTQIASWPTDSWPGTQIASWPSESWPTDLA